MSAKFQFTVEKILYHLEHSLFNLFFIVRGLNVSTYFPQTILFHILLGTKKQFPGSGSLHYIFIDIDTYQDTHFPNIVEKRAQREISGGTEETNNSIEIAYIWIVKQYAFKFFN